LSIRRPLVDKKEKRSQITSGSVCPFQSVLGTTIKHKHKLHIAKLVTPIQWTMNEPSSYKEKYNKSSPLSYSVQGSHGHVVSATSLS